MSSERHNSGRILAQRVEFFQRERPHTWSAAHLRVADALVSDLAGRLVEVEAERDAARRDLARIVQLCGWDCDGNDPETPAGAIHLYADAVQAVQELVEERAEDSREIVLLHRLCSEAAEMLNEPTATGGEAMDAMADRLRAAAGHDTNDRSA